jgi:hypothetical protein
MSFVGISFDTIFSISFDTLLVSLLLPFLPGISFDTTFFPIPMVFVEHIGIDAAVIVFEDNFHLNQSLYGPYDIFSFQPCHSCHL